MKACVIQPPYSRDVNFSQEYFDYKINMLDKCDDTIDIIVLPEYSDVPCATKDREETLFYHKKYIVILLSLAGSEKMMQKASFQTVEKVGQPQANLNFKIICRSWQFLTPRL